MKRKKQTGLVVVAVGLLVAAFGVYTVLAGPSALADDDHSMEVKVAGAVITLNVPTPPTGVTSFIVIGDITHVNGDEASGTFYCRGVFTDPGALGVGLPLLAPGPTPDGISFVDQRFRIGDWGSIIGAGAENSSEPLAVTGGTGRFTGAVGSYTAAGLPLGAGGDGILTFEFSLDDDFDDDD